MENTWRYRTPNIQMESPTVQMVPHYDSGTINGRLIDFNSSHHINRAIGAANDVVYQQSGWIPMQAVADFQRNVARTGLIMRDASRFPGYPLQSSIQYADYSAMPTPQPSYEQIQWTPQALEAHYPMAPAANSLHFTAEGAGFPAISSNLLPTPEPSQTQPSNCTTQSVVTEFPVDAVSRPHIKMENSGLPEYSHEAEESNTSYSGVPDALHNEGPETLSPYEQTSNWTPLAIETNLPVGSASRPQIKVEHSGLSAGSEVSHEPSEDCTSLPDAAYMEVPDSMSSIEQGSCLPHEIGFPTDTGNNTSIKREEPDYLESSYQMEESTTESTVATLQPSYEKDDFEVQESGTEFNHDVKEKTLDHFPDDTSADSSSVAMATQKQEALEEQDRINRDQSQNSVSWPCPTCSQVFRSKDLFCSHNEIHSVTHGFMCTICLKTFAQKGYLRKHMKQHHSNNTTNANTSTQESLCEESVGVSNASFESNGNVDFPSLVQTNSSGNPAGFQNGTQKCGQVNPYNGLYLCNFCSKEFKQKRYLQRHYRDHHAPNRKKFVCTVCGKVLTNGSSLRDHTNIHSKEKAFPCDKCERIFYARKTLRNHKEFCHAWKVENGAGQVPSHHPPEPISCSICSREFADKKQLQMHMRESHSEKPQLPCTLCDRTFSRKFRLKEHMNMHLKEKKYSCDLCERFYFALSSLRTHRLTHSRPAGAPRKLPACEICQHVFPNRSKLADHVRIHTLEMPFQCDVCPSKFRTRQALRYHKMTHSDKRPFPCTVCNKAFYKRHRLNDHLRTHDANRIFKCKLCPETFQTSGERRKHRMTHPKLPNQREKRFVCCICFKGFACSYSLKKHSVKHVAVKPFTCQECGKRYKEQRALRLHKLTHSIPKSFKCTICTDRAFHHDHVLRAHIRYFHSEGHDFKLFACHLCKKRYTSSSALKEHMSTHASEKLFTCDICSRSFRTSRFLRVHLLTHSDSRPFACDICGRTFKLKSTLNGHLKTHSNKRPFLCEICGKTFSNTTGPKHAVIHSKAKQFVCEVCGKLCSRKDNLKTHMKDYSEGLLPTDLTVTGADRTGLPEDNDSSSNFEDDKPPEYLVIASPSGEEIQNIGHQIPDWSSSTCSQISSSSDLLSTTDDGQAHASRKCSYFECQNCLRTFTTQQHLKTHVVAQHADPGERPFACTVCSKTFQRARGLSDHLNIHTKQKKLSRKVCKQSFFSRGALFRHTKAHKQEKQDISDNFNLECKHCLLRFPTKSKLTQHLCSHKPTMFPCKVCGVEFETRHTLKSNSSTVHSSDASVLCRTCNRSFSCKQSLKHHIQTLHKNKDRPFKCTMCDKSFNRKDTLREHVNIHTKEKVFSCVICQHSCYNRGTHRKHMKSHSLEDASAVKNGNITWNYRSEPNNSTVTQHQHPHAKDRELSCEVCSLTFKTVESLHVHRAVHADVKPKQSSKKSSPGHCQPEKLSCSICFKVYSSRPALQRHTKMSHDVTTQRLPCTVCDKTFKCSRNLKNHMNTHTDDKVFSCDICECTSSTRSGLNRHKETHTIKELEAAAEKEILQKYKQSHNQGKLINQFTCLICREIFQSRQVIAEHLQRHVPEIQLKCSICPETFKSRHSVSKHKMDHQKGKPYQCNICGKVFRRKCNMKEHQRIHTRVRQYSCKKCPAKFQDLADLRKHRETHPKPVEVKKHECKICHQKFVRLSILRMHTYKHTTAKPFSCSECGKKFIGKRACQQHELTHRLERSHKCPICGVAFHYPNRLKIHIKSYHTESHDLKLYACDLCDKRYGHLGSLTEHRMSHFDREMYSCSLCDCSFLSKRSLGNHHKSTHATNNDTHHCEVCDKYFKTRSSLLNHLKGALHLNVRPHLCQVCGKTFTLLTGLRRHARIHSENKRFICEVCGKTCLRRDNLRTHMKVHSHSRQKKKVKGI